MWERKTSSDQKLHVIGVVVITKRLPLHQRQQHGPAFRKRCNNFGIIGHFSRDFRSRGGQPREGQPQRQEANLVESEQDEEAFANEAISASSTAKKSATKFFAHLHLVRKEKTKVVRAQIDFASTFNTIPDGSLHKLFPGIKISKSKASISAYANQILHPKGQVLLCCVRRGKLHTLNFPRGGCTSGKTTSSQRE